MESVGTRSRKELETYFLAKGKHLKELSVTVDPDCERDDEAAGDVHFFFFVVVLKELLNYLGPNAEHIVPNLQSLSIGYPYHHGPWATPGVVPPVMEIMEDLFTRVRNHNRTRGA